MSDIGAGVSTVWVIRGSLLPPRACCLRVPLLVCAGADMLPLCLL